MMRMVGLVGHPVVGSDGVTGRLFGWLLEVLFDPNFDVDP
jgi:hypothetical protein